MAERVTQSAFAKIVGISPGRVSQLISEGRIPREPDGKIDVAKASAAYAELRVRVQGGEVRGGGRAISAAEASAPKSSSPVLEHEARKRKAEADFAEVRAATALNKVVEVEKVARLLEAATTMLRIQVTSLDARLASQLAHQDVATIRQRLAAEGDRIVSEWQAALSRSDAG